MGVHPSVPMHLHEIGPNLGLQHSGQLTDKQDPQPQTYEDRTGADQNDTNICFNPAVRSSYDDDLYVYVLPGCANNLLYCTSGFVSFLVIPTLLYVYLPNYSCC